jgi:hypothetical protein
MRGNEKNLKNLIRKNWKKSLRFLDNQRVPKLFSPSF